MLTLEKGNYISRIWFLYKDGATFDVMMVLTRQLPVGPWELKYRFRYYRDNQAFDSKDEKSLWTATFDQKISESEAIRKVAPVLAMLKETTEMNVDVTVIESDDPLVARREMSKKPYFHMRREERSS